MGDCKPDLTNVDTTEIRILGPSTPTKPYPDLAHLTGAPETDPPGCK